MSSFTLPVLTATQIHSLMPLFVLSGVGCLVLILSTFKSENMNRLMRGVTVFGVALTLYFALMNFRNVNETVADMYVFDPLSQFLVCILLCLLLLSHLFSWGFVEREHMGSEFYALSIFSGLGMICLICASDLVFMFVSLELMSLTTYIMVAMRRRTKEAAEAGLKYFILGGVASAVLLYGVTLIYGVLGTTSYAAIVDRTSAFPEAAGSHLMLTGLVFVISGFLFKVGSFPFHFWVPDVYQGAPSNVTGLMISAVKLSSFAAFGRFLFPLMPKLPFHLSEIILNLIMMSGVAAMFFGNSMALIQTNIKRMLAYSSIAHTGYLLLGMRVATQDSSFGIVAWLIYLIFYAVTSLGAFAVISQLSHENDSKLDLEGVKGLGFRYPMAAFCLSVFLFSMAGIPPTAGFLGKYYLFSSLVHAGEVSLAILAILASLIGAYFYLRVMVFMYMKEEDIKSLRMSRFPGAAFVASLAVVLVLKYGVLPRDLFKSVENLISVSWQDSQSELELPITTP